MPRELCAPRRDPQDRQEADRRVGRPGQARPRGQGPDAEGQGPPQPQGLQAEAKADKAAAARPRRRTTGTDAEWIAGRNSVVEALRAGVPVTDLYVAEGAERDGRLREAFKLAAERGIGLLEVTKASSTG